MSNERKKQTQVLVLGAILTALVVILQFMGSFIRFGPFAISLVLIPIVIGAATCGVKIGTWLGFIFGVVVLISGDASAFLAVNVFGTIVTVLLKGAACGLAAGLIYKLLEKYNRYVAVIAAAVVCPIVNTGVFLLGCVIFFMDTVAEWGAALGFGGTLEYMFLGLVGGNFLFELASNIILSPVIVRVLNIKNKK
ncbi:MAG: ECF transporter S component [Acutalibacteraceae bacterium]|nr:ECF transporter S component [Acutalibacteraceae bacterium]